jgi:hypothetical protein
MQALKWIVGIVGGGFILLMVFGLSMSPERSALYDQERRVKEACEQMLSDSALGTERRMTRAMCDKMKADIEAKKRTTK